MKMRLSVRQLFVALLFLALLILTMRPIADPDFWWHLRTGELIADTHAVPRSDPFSFTVAGKPWIAHEWLSELLMYFLYRLGGFGLLIIAFAAVITIAFLLTYLRCPSSSRPYVAGFSLLLGALATAPTWGVRPQMISLILTALFPLLLDRFLQTKKILILVALPIVTLVWVNLHAGFALGLAVIVIYILGEVYVTLKGIIEKTVEPELAAFKSTFWLLGCLAVCGVLVIVNPNGIQMYIYPFETLVSPSMQQFIQEWASPDFHQAEWQPLAGLIIALLGAGLFSRKRISLTDILLVLLFGYATLRSMRNVTLFAVVAIPVLADEVASFLPAVPRVQVKNRGFNWIAPALLVATFFAAGLRFVSVIQQQSKTEQEVFPKSAVDWIVKNHPQGNIYNTYAWGGYLIWRLYPDDPVYIDGRADVYGDQFIYAYVNLYRGQGDWRAPFSTQGVRLVLIEPGSGLADRLRQSPEWQIAYQDKLSIIFTPR